MLTHDDQVRCCGHRNKFVPFARVENIPLARNPAELQGLAKMAFCGFHSEGMLAGVALSIRVKAIVTLVADAGDGGPDDADFDRTRSVHTVGGPFVPGEQIGRR